MGGVVFGWVVQEAGFQWVYGVSLHMRAISNE